MMAVTRGQGRVVVKIRRDGGDVVVTSGKMEER